jgi:hypothetical protein
VKSSQPPADRARLAYQSIETLGWRIEWSHKKPVPDDAWPIDLIRKQIDAEVYERTELMRSALVAAKTFCEWPSGAENHARVLQIIAEALGVGR